MTQQVGSNGFIAAGDSWYSSSSVQLAKIDGIPFEMGDMLLASADQNLLGCILSVYIKSILGNGDAAVQIVLFNPLNNGDVTFNNPTMNFKVLVVK